MKPFRRKGRKSCYHDMDLRNVNSVKDTYHADANHRGVQLASGQSPSVFKTLVGSMGLTPFEYMMSVINVERYAVIKA